MHQFYSVNTLVAMFLTVNSCRVFAVYYGSAMTSFIRSLNYRAGITGNGVGEGEGVAVLFVITTAVGVTGELVSNPRAMSIQSCAEGFSG